MKKGLIMYPHESSAKSMAQMPSVGEQQQYWDDRWGRERDPNGWQLRRGETILTFLRSLSLHQPKILDLGCGTGWFTDQLRDIGKPTGIDLSETAIGLARFQYPDITFIAADLYKSTFQAGTFDVVVAQEVIPHVQDQDTFLKLIGTILKPNGYLALTMVNKFVINRVEWDHGPSSHIIQWLSMKELKQLLRPHFRILRATTIIPNGNQGILRIVNSYKLNKILQFIIPKEIIDAMKERSGCGYTRIVLAQKNEVGLLSFRMRSHGL